QAAIGGPILAASRTSRGLALSAEAGPGADRRASRVVAGGRGQHVLRGGRLARGGTNGGRNQETLATTPRPRIASWSSAPSSRSWTAPGARGTFGGSPGRRSIRRDAPAEEVRNLVDDVFVQP